jgi:acetoin utilization protein AcuB
MSNGRWTFYEAVTYNREEDDMFVKSKMERNPITINPEASFFEAQKLIREEGVRHLPVVDKKGKLVGLVTDRDIREAGPSDATLLSVQEINYLLGKLKVGGFMTPAEKLVTVTPDTIIEKAVQLLHDNKIGSLPVVDGNKVVGIITETDILELFVDVVGLNVRGTRITMLLEDEPGKLFGVLKVIKDQNINVISIISPTLTFEGKRMVVIRIKTHEYEDVVKKLEKAGYEIMNVTKWPSL